MILARVSASVGGAAVATAGTRPITQQHSNFRERPRSIAGPPCIQEGESFRRAVSVGWWQRNHQGEFSGPPGVLRRFFCRKWPAPASELLAPATALRFSRVLHRLIHMLGFSPVTDL